MVAVSSCTPPPERVDAGTCGAVTARCADAGTASSSAGPSSEGGSSSGTRASSNGTSAAPDAGQPTLRGLTVTELENMLVTKDFLMIDVHVPYEGDIPGTDTSVRYDDTSALQACVGAELARKVVLTCKSGSMSTTAGNALVAHGYSNVSHLVGGMNAWVGQGRILEHVDGGLPACP